MTTERATVLLLTGRPGIGKTTVVRKVAENLSQRPSGFYTEEVREKYARRGFRAVTFDGDESIIADVDRHGPPRVGKYGVDVSVIDRLADTVLRSTRTAAVFIIDEIGKMECSSTRFVEATQRLLDSGQLVVATIGQKGGGFITEVKQRADAELWVVTRENRDEMPGRVLEWIERRPTSPTQ
jgi:nucleoside-triphosphatase